jgi:ABC-2 type transport system permease protein
MHPNYFRYELLRNFRNWRYILFSLAHPVVLYFVVTGPQRHATFDGTSFPLYFMAGMATVGTMIAVISSGARIAADRSAGWTRQLRITPLTAADYLGARVVCGFLMALLAIALVCLSGTALGVRLDAGEWLTMIGLILVGLIPVTVLGILLGHLVTPDSLAPRGRRNDHAARAARRRVRIPVGRWRRARGDSWSRTRRPSRSRTRSGAWPPASASSIPRSPPTPFVAASRR